MATQPVSGIHSVMLFVSNLADNLMTNGLLHALYIFESLRIDQVRRALFFAVQQEVIVVIVRIHISFLVPNLRRP